MCISPQEDIQGEIHVEVTARAEGLGQDKPCATLVVDGPQGLGLTSSSTRARFWALQL